MDDRFPNVDRKKLGFLRFQVFPTQAQLEHFVRFEVRLLEDVANFHSFTRIQNTIRVQVWIRKTCGVELNRETSTTQRGGGVLVSDYAPSIPSSEFSLLIFCV